MADIPVEKKSGGGGWWKWLLGLLLLALIIWAIAAAIDTDESNVTEVEPVTPTTTPEPIAQAPTVTIGDILGNPTEYVGDDFADVYPRAEVQVGSVPTDRGFWVVDQGDSLFAVIIDVPEEQPNDIDAGQTLRIQEAILRDRTFLPQIPGVPLDADTERIAEQQPIFLTVDETNISILQGGGQ